MPEVIDNVKVGQFIKDLLKKNNMTQDNLAEKLNITKSAVSQNLNGKSAFDIQNLMRIASLFNITLDDLLNCRLPKESDNKDLKDLSEYERVLQRGIEEFKKIPAENVQISKPDLSGKVLMDYVIESNNLIFFHYILDQKINFVDVYFHRAPTLIAQVLVYSLEHQTGHIKSLIQYYSDLNTSLAINDDLVEKKLWRLIEDNKNLELIDFINNSRTDQPNSIIRFTSKKVPILSPSQWIRIMGTYQLPYVAEFILGHQLVDNFHLEEWVFYCLESSFYEGIKLFVEKFFAKSMGMFDKKVIQSLMIKLIERDEVNLFTYLMKKGYYTDGSALFIFAQKINKKSYVEQLYGSFFWSLDIEKVAIELIHAKSYDILKMMKERLTQPILDRLLAEVAMDDITSLLFLLDLGSQFTMGNYNSQMMAKVNHLLEYYRKKGDH